MPSEALLAACMHHASRITLHVSRLTASQSSRGTGRKSRSNRAGPATLPDDTARRRPAWCLWRMPSTVWSLRLMRSTATSAGSVAGSTANPWFWDGDLHPAGLQVLHRLVGAAVAELQLEGLARQRPGPESGGPGKSQKSACRSAIRSLHGLHGIPERRGIARAVGKEDAGRLVLQRLGGRWRWPAPPAP